jgi:hypothetical protein
LLRFFQRLKSGRKRKEKEGIRKEGNDAQKNRAPHQAG